MDQSGGVILRRMGHRNHKKDHLWATYGNLSSQKAVKDQDELIQPKKLVSPTLESSDHRRFHRELLLSIRRALLPGKKPELLRVLEQRRFRQQRERELALGSSSDLELELRKRQQRLLEYELEERRSAEDQKNIPEFVRVRENLRHIQVSRL
ncbi:protein FAM107B [Denticeps clupeoides]|uniref:protein FAM107B n=1 Tax=Denticeps clupeoides TaxID=299321 RepID=UPI0010A3A2A0|nr:protein FAM107B-like [Denticeps clupeoides]